MENSHRLKMVERDEWLRPVEGQLLARHEAYEKRLDEIRRTAGSLVDYANGYRYFGWQRDEIKDFLNKNVKKGMSARCIAWLLASACNDFYIGEPGDDTTVAAVRVREELKINLMVGPPLDKEKDDFYVARFLSDCDKKIVCGGTSSQIVARYLG